MSPTPGAKSLSSSQEQASRTARHVLSEPGVSSSPPQLSSATIPQHAGESGKESGPPSQADTPASTSRRESSEESYDLLSSENASVAGENKDSEKPGEGDDPDSDWE